jgi:hypothetical protein
LQSQRYHRRIDLLIAKKPYAGSDVANLQATAKKTPDGKFYIVNGEKKWITNGVFADYFTVAVRTGGAGQSSHDQIRTNKFQEWEEYLSCWWRSNSLE